MKPPSTAQQRGGTPLEYILTAIVALVIVLVTGVNGRDYLPLSWALRLELGGGSAYGPEMQAAFAARYPPPFGAAGFGYPLPAMWLAAPIVLLPDGVAAIVWALLSVGSLALGLYLLGLPAILLLFAPVLSGLSLHQVTVPLVGLSLVGIWALRERRWLGLGIVVALTLAAKPQASGLFALALLAIGLRRGGGWRLLAPGLLLAGATFALEPGWVGGWLEALARYRQFIGTYWAPAMLAAAAAMLALGRPWGALAFAQSFLFPGLLGYTLLPLIVAAVEERSRLATFAAVLASWLVPPLALLLPILPASLLCLAAPWLIAAIVARMRGRLPAADPPAAPTTGRTL